MEQIAFVDPQTGDEVLFYVIEETKLSECSYLLVADSQAQESDACILKEVTQDPDGTVTYEIVENDRELDAVAKVFSELLDDDMIIE